MAGDPVPGATAYARIVFHAVLAGAVCFALNWAVLAQPLETSVLWGVLAAPFAAYLAWTQQRRG